MRPFIRARLEIAGRDHEVELCLQDRTRMRHRLILERRLLRLGFQILPERNRMHPRVLTLPRSREPSPFFPDCEPRGSG